MHDLNAFEEFEPSRGTKDVWLFTRKKSSNYWGMPLPGLFQTEHSTIDASGFVVVIILELWGLQSILIVGDTPFTYVAVLFLADLVFAIGRHLPQAKLCEYHNRLLVPDDRHQHKDVARLKASITKRKLITHVFTLLIFALAGFKIIGFVALEGGEFTGLTLAISLSYGVAAVLHVTCTGYFLFGLATSILFQSDRRKYLRLGSKRLVPRQFQFRSSADIQETTVDRHRLYRGQDESHASESSANDGTWFLETTGVLTDGQLGTLVNSQPDRPASHEVALAALFHQLQILQAEPQYVDEGGANA
jgi:hypothetical protein